MIAWLKNATHMFCDSAFHPSVFRATAMQAPARRVNNWIVISLICLPWIQRPSQPRREAESGVYT